MSVTAGLMRAVKGCMKFEQLQQRLGYHFGDSAILVQACTHKSYGHENLSDQPIALRDNERLEFLGDAVLDLVLSDLLLETFPNSDEGQLSKMRASIVNERTLAQVACSIHLNDSIRLGKGESMTGGHFKPSILSSTLEALMAAVYLDGGFSAVYPVVRLLFNPFFEDERELIAFYDHKTQLQEMVQAQWKVTPTYHLKAASGPDHAKVFEVEVRVNNAVLASASGSSKKDAEQNAARAAIRAVSA